MAKLKNISYELRDVAIMQAPVSFINHRDEVDPLIEICNRGVYPIFVAPMGAVTNEDNYQVWIDNKLTPVVPRSVQTRLSFNERMQIAYKTFVSISLSEAKNEFLTYLEQNIQQIKSISGAMTKLYICIDIAHGTLIDLYSVCKQIKSVAGQYVEIMTGNVANARAYSLYADAGIDWMRCCIGSGNRCTSSANLGLHVGTATLLDSLNEERKAYAHSHNGYAPTKLIADGGISWFDDIQKALALGADAVMCGKIFAECEEACETPFYMVDGFETRFNTLEAAEHCIHSKQNKIRKYRDYWGMSTKRAQKEQGGDGSKTSEGIDKPVEIKYPVAKWIDNMQSYLRSCMTYTNSRTILELRENAQVVILGGSGDLAYRK